MALVAPKQFGCGDDFKNNVAESEYRLHSIDSDKAANQLKNKIKRDEQSESPE